MSFLSVRRPFVALAMLAVSSGVFAAPTNPVGGVLDGVLPRWSSNQDYGAVEARGYKMDGGNWPKSTSDCFFDEPRRDEGGDWYDHDGKKFEGDCLLKLSLSIDAEKRESCRTKHGKHGYEDECLFELVFKLDVEIEIEQQEKKHVEDWDQKRQHPTRKSDCRMDWGKFNSRAEGCDEEWCSWSNGPGGKDKYDDDCLFKLSISLDIDIKNTCKKDKSGGKEWQGYNIDCMLDLAISLDLDLNLDIVDKVLGSGEGGGWKGAEKALDGLDKALGLDKILGSIL